MNNEYLAAGRGYCFYKSLQKIIIVVAINADSGFYRYRDINSRSHLGNRSGYSSRFQHQTHTEHSRLYTVTGTADVDIDLVVAVFLTLFGGKCHIRRVGTSELQRNRALK